jgi:hypothetical protein
MKTDFTNTLVIGVSSRALFDLEEENRIFETEHIQAYRKYLSEHEAEPLKVGTAFYLVKNLLELNPDRPIEKELHGSRNQLTAGEGKLFFSSGTTCRRLARRRYYPGPSIRCGAVVPARKLNPYVQTGRDI